MELVCWYGQLFLQRWRLMGKTCDFKIKINAQFFLPIANTMSEMREKNDPLILMGLCKKLWYCLDAVQWYHRSSTLKEPLPKIGRTPFPLVWLYSWDELGHHKKCYQNHLKNKKVMTRFSLFNSRRRINTKMTMSESPYFWI